MIAAMLLSAALAASPLEAGVYTLDGQHVAGTVASLSNEAVGLETSSGVVNFEAGNITAIIPSKAPAKAPAPAVSIELLDGSTLAAADYLVKDQKAQVALAGGEAVEIPTAWIASVRLKQQNEKIREQWRQVLDHEAASDVIVVRKADALDYLEGVLGDVSADEVQFQLDGDAVPVKRPKVEGFRYFRPKPPEYPAPVCRLSDASGTKLQIKKISLADEALAIETPAGLKVRLPLAQLARIDYGQYLSDLKTDSADWSPSPLFGEPKPSANQRGWYRLRTDRGQLVGRMLELAGKTYAKGLALQSRTQVTWKLPGKFSRLTAMMGLDQSDTELAGAVRVIVQGDGKTLFEAPVAGGAEPSRLDVNIKGVKRLTIVVDYGENRRGSDQLNLCDARIR